MGDRAFRARMIAAFAALYFIWGSTYLGIRFAIETIPPFLMAGSRLVLAGVPLFLWALARGHAWPRASQWLEAAVVGGLLFVGGHGAVSWSEQWVPTGAAALIIGTLPLWMAILDALRDGGAPIDRRTGGGLLIGFLGVGLLIGPEDVIGGPRPDPVASAVLLLGAFSWAVGSVLSRKLKRLPETGLATSMQLLTGGGLLWILGIATGEPGRFEPAAVSARSALALLYLAFVGSLIGFSAFSWLLRVTTPARVSTYAYVNPVVAVLIGWGLGGEALTPRILSGGLLIVSAVVLILARRRAGASRAATPRSIALQTDKEAP